GFGSPILIPVGALLVTTYGWRAAVVFIGVIYVVMGVTSSITLFHRHGPESYGLLPDNEEPKAVSTATEAQAGLQPVVALKDFTVREALKTSSFWFLVVGGFVGQLAGGYTVLPLFQSARMQEAGYTVAVAAL